MSDTFSPRLPSSKKWTAFPGEYSDQIREAFQNGFGELLEGAQLHIEGRIYPSEILLRVGLLQKGRLAQANFEISINYDNQQNVIDKIYTCIDAAGTLMGDYLETHGHIEYPRTWKEFPFENEVLYMQFSTVNTALEAEADALLGEAKEELVHDITSEDALDRAEEHIEMEDEEDDFDEEFDDDEDEDDLVASSSKKKQVH